MRGPGGVEECSPNGKFRWPGCHIFAVRQLRAKFAPDRARGRELTTCAGPAIVPRWKGDCFRPPSGSNWKRPVLRPEAKPCGAGDVMKRHWELIVSYNSVTGAAVPGCALSNAVCNRASPISTCCRIRFLTSFHSCVSNIGNVQSKFAAAIFRYRHRREKPDSKPRAETNGAPLKCRNVGG